MSVKPKDVKGFEAANLSDSEFLDEADCWYVLFKYSNTKNQQADGLQAFAKYKKEGSEVYKAKKAGKPKTRVNPSFVKKVVEIRKSMDYESEKGVLNSIQELKMV